MRKSLAHVSVSCFIIINIKSTPICFGDLISFFLNKENIFDFYYNM